MKMQSKRQAGMTLIELIIVVVVIGVLAIVGARAFSSSGVTDNAKANAIFEGTKKLSTNLVMLAQFAGVSSDFAATSLPVSGSSVMDVLVQGSGKLKPEYASAWTQSGIMALSDVAQGSGVSYTIAGYDVKVAGGGTGPHTFTLSVPEAVANSMVVKYGSGNVPIATAADSTAPVIRYKAVANGMREVTIVRPL
ncbi:prepilin-type N-terminal cleavage/methylation domain-containing protein [Massilia sp. MP_M2]|uniref:prepilin-type N-terminal cleavage/methylation domain-containing protein n=1 Tax=Massilia sp. MP_M2 TaxID=3071713 RepID=UPI00319E9F5A